MRVLLDTHALLWWITDDLRLSSSARKILSDKNNHIMISAVSGLEIAIKSNLGKLKLSKNIEAFISEQLRDNAMESLPIQMSHALHVSKLPNHHKDPFDRLLIAQSQLENLPIVTGDSQIARYPVKTIW